MPRQTQVRQKPKVWASSSFAGAVKFNSSDCKTRAPGVSGRSQPTWLRNRKKCHKSTRGSSKTKGIRNYVIAHANIKEMVLGSCLERCHLKGYRTTKSRPACSSCAPRQAEASEAGGLLRHHHQPPHPHPPLSASRLFVMYPLIIAMMAQSSRASCVHVSAASSSSTTRVAPHTLLPALNQTLAMHRSTRSCVTLCR